MVSYEYTKECLPAKLTRELRVAQIAVLGVTANEVAGKVSKVQVLCDDGTLEPPVATVVAAHSPVPDPPTQQQANAATISTALQNAMLTLQTGIDAINAGTITSPQRDALLKVLAQCIRQEIRVLMSLYDATG